MTVLGIQEGEIKAILCVLAAIYHMGVAGAVKGTYNGYHEPAPLVCSIPLVYMVAFFLLNINLL